MGIKTIRQHAADQEVKPGIRQRLEFIEFRLFWEERVNRADLMEQFEISVPQASLDLKKYQELAPDNLVYEKGAKTYRPSSSFRPLFYQPDARGLLEHLAEPESAGWSSVKVPVSKVNLPLRALEPTVVKSMLLAIHRRQALEIEYQSMSKPDPGWRTVSPHALGFDGRRWHARAFCHRDGAYKDYVLARITAIKPTAHAWTDGSGDSDWNESVAMRLIPAEGLSAGQRASVETDFGMEEGCLTIEVPVAMGRYYETQLCVDEAFDNAPPVRKQLELENKKAFRARIKAPGQSN